jgi:hypothetical protein
MKVKVPGYFDAIDTDESGHIDRDEFHKLMNNKEVASGFAVKRKLQVDERKQLVAQQLVAAIVQRAVVGIAFQRRGRMGGGRGPTTATAAAGGGSAGGSSSGKRPRPDSPPLEGTAPKQAKLESQTSRLDGDHLLAQHQPLHLQPAGLPIGLPVLMPTGLGATTGDGGGNFGSERALTQHPRLHPSQLGPGHSMPLMPRLCTGPGAPSSGVYGNLSGGLGLASPRPEAWEATMAPTETEEAGAGAMAAAAAPNPFGSPLQQRLFSSAVAAGAGGSGSGPSLSARTYSASSTGSTGSMGSILLSLDGSILDGVFDQQDGAGGGYIGGGEDREHYTQEAVDLADIAAVAARFSRSRGGSFDVGSFEHDLSGGCRH